ncbi:hypothetical protein BKA70DRAFT_1133883, partial [Coprinopsis sp. MPI-PUGE-AT-0042]
TLRRHIESNHKGRYHKWCSDNNFESKLPKDVRSRKAAAALASQPAAQATLDGHLKEKEVVISYSDDAFKQIAVEWLIETDQPVQAFENKKFREMIHMAFSSAGITISKRWNRLRHDIVEALQFLKCALRTDRGCTG